jgi:hypothetical protein
MVVPVLWTNGADPLRHGAMAESAARVKASTPGILAIGGGYVGMYTALRAPAGCRIAVGEALTAGPDKRVAP